MTKQKYWLVSICLVVPLQLSAAGQSRSSRIAYDFCYPVAGDSGYETHCEIRVSDGGTTVASLMPGLKPVWSSDGLRIAAASGSAFGGGDIYLFSLAESTVVNLTNRNAWHGPPRWSPDDTRIAFASTRDGTMELYVMNADGSALTRLTQNVGARGEFAWSPDGGAIAFAGTVDDVPELFVMRADGSHPTRLTFNVGFNTPSVFSVESAPSWSPDGARIAFDCVNDICSVNADGTDFTRLTTDPVGAAGGVFSPVDGKIAFVTAQFDHVEIAVMAADATVTRPAPGFGAAQHVWSPRGEHLAFTHVTQRDYAIPADGSHVENETIYTVNSDGTDLRTLVSGQNPQWAPWFAGQPVARFTSACLGAVCQFDADGSFDPDGRIATYLWKFGDGTTSSDAAPAHTYATGADYNVVLVVTDDGGSTDVALNTVRANAPPVASFVVACSGPTCTFDGSASSDPDGTIAQYRWTFGDDQGQEGAGSTTTHTYPSGVFMATLFVRDNGGWESWTQQTITIVNAVPAASFSVACTNLTCTYDASGSSDQDGTIRDYLWEFGDSSAHSYDRVAAHTYAAGGSFSVRLSVWDDAGQRATTSRTVTVSPPPVTSLHIGDLDGSTTNQQKTWTASVSIQVHRENHAVAAGAVVSGSWNDGTAASCTTDGSGRCVFTRVNLPRKTTSVTLAVSGAAQDTHVYHAAGNHDPDAESNGTTIMVSRP